MRRSVRRGRAVCPTTFVATVAACALVAGCASSGPGTAHSTSYPTRDAAFRRGEVYINRLLVAAGLSPTTAFEYAEGPCDETDPDHGDVDLDVDLPGTFTSTTATAMLHKVAAAMQQLGYGAPSYEDNAGAGPDAVGLDIGTYSVLLSDDNGTMGLSVQTCYSTPAPTASPGSAGVMHPTAVSPAPTSVSTEP